MVCRVSTDLLESRNKSPGGCTCWGMDESFTAPGGGWAETQAPVSCKQERPRGQLGSNSRRWRREQGESRFSELLAGQKSQGSPEMDSLQGPPCCLSHGASGQNLCRGPL